MNTAMNDTLASVGLSEDAMKSLLEAAQKLAQPAERKALAPVVDWKNARIGMQSELGFSVIAQFAARIVETIEMRDDLNGRRDTSGDAEVGALMHVLEVVTTPEVEGKTRKVHRISTFVADDDLGKPGNWLTRFGAVVKAAGDDREGRHDEAIGRAISAYARESRKRVRVVHPNTGWVQVDRKWMFLTDGNAISADGNSDGYSARLPNGRRATVHAPDGDDAAERARQGFQWVMEMLETPDTKNLGGRENRTAGIAVLAAAVWAMAGLPVSHGVLLYSTFGSGKSTFLRCIARSVLPLGQYTMAPSGSTGTVVSDLYAGLHQFILILDDFVRSQSSRREEENVEQGVDRLARIAYDGPEAAARARMEQTPGGKWVTGSVDKSWPTFVMAGEKIPQNGSVSGVSRLFGVPFHGVNLALTKDTEGLENLRSMWGIFIQEIAKRRDADASGFEQRLMTARDERAIENAAKYGHSFGDKDGIARRAGILAILQTGYELLMDVLGLDVQEGDHELLAQAAVEYASDISDKRADGTENVLEALRAKVATDPRFTLGNEAELFNVNTRSLGRIGTVKQEDGSVIDAVFIVPSVAIEILGWDATPASNEKLEQGLKSLLVPGAKRKQRLGGPYGIRVHTIPLSAWGETEDPDEEPEPF